MTTSQIKSIERVKRMAEELFYDRNEYEIKEFTVKEYDHFVSVVVVTGRKGDEGTLAVIGRDRAHVFIGKRGAITYPVASKRDGHQIEKVIGPYTRSLIGVVVAQRDF